MTESFVTQCPQCQTSFRVNTTQLGAAHGAVRCGACLNVFNAAKQLQQQGHVITPAASKPLPAAPPVAATSKAKAPDDTLWIHDDLDLDELDLDEELAKLEEREQQLSQEFLKLERSTHFSSVFASPPSNTPAAHDERWAEELLREDESKPAEKLAIEPLGLKQKDTHSSPPPATQPFQQQPPPAQPLNREPEFQLTDADFGVKADVPAAASPEPITAQPEELQRPEPTLGAIDDEPEPVPFIPVQIARHEANVGHNTLFELEDEPVEFDWQKPGPSWGRIIGWSILILLAAGALAGQYVAYHFEQLARQDQYRPLFEQICPKVGCELPSKVDISMIKSSNLVVRSHPEFSGALVVDAIIYNRAAFSQPFPLLEMRFADINGKLLASRRFTPGEYLAGELAGRAEMPPQTPIHISLDILDPGSQAVNYSLSFHSPQ
ncbi:DUF3426 domain-containing protein [Pseudomonas sp. EL_65y_Pfl2_R95]|uniref:DUF3426 domain-containing protein n=1 Tax=Pseudomonas sp. EL_65y_Pfl2_R95 TaxID=3088698 RepID=UPI0030DA717C